MKKQIRRSVFETNSSSTHVLTIATKKQFEAWKKNELYLDGWNNKFIVVNKETQQQHIEDYDYIETYEEYWSGNYENFKQSFRTPSGDDMVAFGYYYEYD